MGKVKKRGQKKYVLRPQSHAIVQDPGGYLPSSPSQEWVEVEFDDEGMAEDDAVSGLEGIVTASQFDGLLKKVYTSHKLEWQSWQGGTSQWIKLAEGDVKTETQQAPPAPAGITPDYECACPECGEPVSGWEPLVLAPYILEASVSAGTCEACGTCVMFAAGPSGDYPHFEIGGVVYNRYWDTPDGRGHWHTPCGAVASDTSLGMLTWRRYFTGGRR